MVTNRSLRGVFLAALGISSLLAFLYSSSTASGPGFAAGGFPLDDSWIHQVYARNIAQGRPFQYNPGEWETGSTSPLWAVLLAPAHIAGVSPVAWAKLLGVVLLACAGAAGYAAGEALGRRRAGIAFALSLPAIPYFSFASVSGTEVALFLFLSLVTIERLLRGFPGMAGIAGGLAVLARPEGAILLVVAAAVQAARKQRPFRFILHAGAVVSPWVIYCLLVTGRPLPSTFYVKSSWGGLFNPEGLRGIGALVVSQPFLGADSGSLALTILNALVGVPLVALGLWRMARQRPEAAILIASSSILFLYALSLGHPFGAVGAADHPGSARNFYFARYALPAFGPLLLLWWVGLLDGSARWNRRRAVRVAIPIVLSLSTLASGLQHGRLRSTYSWNCRNIEELQVAAARWIAMHIPAGARVGVSDAGAMRYFGGHPIVDLVGLNSHRILPIVRALSSVAPGTSSEQALRERFWRQDPPEYLAVTPGWHDPLVRGKRLPGVREFRIERNTICASSVLLVVGPVTP